MESKTGDKVATSGVRGSLNFGMNLYSINLELISYNLEIA